ncbi:hypothetical protein COCC4DRAFT_77352 [Bipolaris maydis ATCC 48331]|uniref:Uncharacterized protein n=2 Tax=Cochliobolus heterostrophus TaxID=5016 RepID=M2UB07_COCH5|nr:uncharacterized protein COCC4DRAFT_77352 [Bipolaris maydis ATCC 48331]EMD95754.1 hypothetical protein COCHEDRAFT_1200734 [Bipolaris maydis C5]KAJ5030482.1 hypothetical protein J3E73DRAFT_404851 [Bipolaris maydis]ENI10613.1 hypothetical protein COCC4DRAFT_77352 [Bipolaris maydis ATCC 48331]KAJ6213453.1 hypothetical protein PSV09DRAFT_1200734 [Bipolaris maydis]KAJ6274676.1 hypothetical protein PSV08DRAFT_384233 [Bipolaris maydis]
MSWNGPVGGAAPFQQQPYTNGPPPYGQQPPYQYGQQPGQQPRYGQYQSGASYPPNGPPNRAPHVQPPKKKGNPIITRYPPPPGYRGPAQPQGPFGTSKFPNSYKPSHTGFPPSSAPSNYPQQSYAAPPANQSYSNQSYGQQAHQAPGFAPPYPQTENGYQWSKSSYPPNSGYSQNSIHPTAQPYAYSHSSYQGYPSQPATVDSGHPSYGKTGAWSQQYAQAPYQSNQHSSFSGQTHGQPVLDPEATPTPATAHLTTSQPPQQPVQPSSVVSDGSMSDRPQLFLAWDDWDFDFDGAIWPKSNEPVDPALSLGVIIWHPAKQVTRALPSTFAEAEEDALKPTPEKLDNGDSVSMYFTADNSHEAFLNVRQTDDWEAIQDDPVFVVFTDEDMQNNLVTLEDCIAQRDRPDEPEDMTTHDGDMEMRDATWDIMDNLEQALSTNHGGSTSSASKTEAVSPLQGSQEDILAKLGVTGAPKPPSNEPILVPYSPSEVRQPVLPVEKPSAAPSPAPLRDSAQPIQRAQSYGGHRNSGPRSAPPRPYGSMSAGAGSRPPPPPPAPAEQRHESWNAPQSNGHSYDNPRESPARSEGSNRTMAGSDFEPESRGNESQQDAPVVPSLDRSDSSFSRKRSYEDTDQEHEKLRQQDDHSKRKRRSQVDAAYSRR